MSTKFKIKILMSLLAVLASFMMAASVYAAPANPLPREITQANGTKITITNHGDEYFSWQEDEEEYVVAYDENTGNWCYAYIYEGKILPQTSQIAGGSGLARTMSPVLKLKRDDLTSLVENVERFDHSQNLKPVNQGINTFSIDVLNAPAAKKVNEQILLVLIEFSDVKLVKDEAYWQGKYFSTAAGAKSVVNYYKEVSNGLDVFKPVTESITSGTVDGCVVDAGVSGNGVVKVTLNTAHPLPTWSTSVAPYAELRVSVLKALSAISGQLDLTQSNLNITCVIAGYDASGGGGAGQGQAWAHASTGYFTVGSQNISKYMVHGEKLDSTDTMDIGVAAHELGHMLGLPDLYDTTNASMGLGPYSLMASGSWGSDSGDAVNGMTPVHLDAWSKIQLGYVTPTVVTSTEYAKQNVNSVSTGNYNVLKVTSTVNPDQYFLIENRQLTNYDTGLWRWINEGGIMIYHIDESLYGTNGNNNNFFHKLVDIEEADGTFYLDENDWNGLYNSKHFFRNEASYKNLLTEEAVVPNTRFHTASHTTLVSASVCHKQTVSTNIHISVNTALNQVMEVEVGVKPVTSITGVPTTAMANTPLVISTNAVVNPADASNKTIVWSIVDAGTTGATLTGSTLNTTALGTVIVRATITNGLGIGSNYTQDFTITVGAGDLTITNPTVGTVYSGTMLSNIELVGGSAVNGSGVTVPGRFEWVNPTTVLTVSGACEIKFIPDDLTTYNVTTAIINVTVDALPAGKVATPNIVTDPADTTAVAKNTEVTLDLQVANENSGIYFTLNGSTPDITSYKYDAGIDYKIVYDTGGNSASLVSGSAVGVPISSSSESVTIRAKAFPDTVNTQTESEVAVKIINYVDSVINPPTAKSTIPTISVEVGENDSFNADDIADIGDASFPTLTITAITGNDESIATAELVAGVVTVTGVAEGTTSVDATVWDDNQSVVVTVPIEVTQAVTYQLTITAGTGGSITVGTSGNYSENEVIQIAAVPDTGYSFNGWTSSGGGSFTNAANAVTGFTMPANAVTVTANFVKDPVSYSITVNTNGNGLAGASVTEALPGAVVTLSAFPNSGYLFSMWYSPDVLISGNSFIMPAKNVTVTAYFEMVAENIPETTPDPFALPQTPYVAPAPAVTPAPTATPVPVSGPDDINNQVANFMRNNRDAEIVVHGNNAEVTISSANLLYLMENELSLIIKGDGVSLTLDPQFVKGLGLAANGDVVIVITPTKAIINDDVTALDPLNKSLLELTYDITIMVNDVVYENFEYPLLITFNLQGFNLTEDQINRLTGVRYVDSRKRQQLGGKYNKNGIFEFRTFKLSKYGILISDNLVSIAAAIGKTEYTVNGGTKTSDAAPLVIDDRTMVPVRFIAEAFGAQVNWIDITKTVSITLGSETLEFRIGMDYLYPGMDVSPIIVNDRTFVPLRYVAEKFGANVIWNADTKSIEIYR